ncbi:MAG: DUF1549 and DUF1553 domain-containing protein [Verrucomicrobiota bacterium]
MARFQANRWSQGIVLAALLCAGSLPASEVPKAEPESDINWAKEQQFWSFRAPAAQPLPAVKNKSWVRQPLDQFILARLEEKKLAPSAEADKRTLIRRIAYDLTGLPPTPEEVKAFLADHRADAYEQLVERLLASPRFGERLASVWLPLVRYAEDQAHQVGTDTKYFYPNAYRYREWVIDAFNRDLPYHQFIRLQLAADKIADASENDLAALGFIGLGPKYYSRGKLEVKADEWEDRVDTVTRSLLGLTVACARCHDHKFEPVTMHDYYALAGVFASTDMVNKTPGGAVEKEVAADKLPVTALHIVQDGAVTNLNIFIRGNVDRKGPEVEKRFLRILSNGEPKPFTDGSGRLELAEAIASETNPLTSRVIVNRLWGVFFGRPLVETPSNFGHSGLLPSHPQLLDDLAVRFVKNGWSIKTLAREMALSATYRQTSRVEARKAAADVENDLLGRMNRRRLSVEQWRDAVLYVAGDLEPEGGKSLELDDPQNHRRTVYARVSRLKLNDLLMQFDYPDANVHAEKRATTTTAMQKLFLLNSPFVIGEAKALAARLAEESSDSARVRRAYEWLFAREPDRTELKVALEFLRKPGAPEMSRWEQYAQMLLASNEMLYVD